MAEYAALLMACHEAEMEDPNSNLGDPREFLIQCFKDMTPDILEAVNRTIFNPQSLSMTVFQVIEFWMKDPTVKIESELPDHLMKELLKESAKACPAVHDYFSNKPAAKKNFPATYLEALQQVEPGLWAKEAEKYSVSNSGIAAKLLDYQANTDKQSFYRIAKTLFPVFTDRIIDHITPYLDLSVEKVFAREVLSFKVLKYRRLDDYMLLAGLFNTETEKLTFIGKLRDRWNNQFFIKVLDWEGMFGRIIEFARKTNPDLDQLRYILPPVINEYPQESFRIARKQIGTEMAETKGRPALKDELRKVGLL